MGGVKGDPGLLALVSGSLAVSEQEGTDQCGSKTQLEGCKTQMSGLS